ncbi:G-protein coupled receptor GRL101-like [Diadema antillarum]|uniref:G-protein coupled receptor GRL101-like n=1 Tax=Diadema antillarum TaxID=105358 RepID=UPI003A83FC4F
MVNSILNHLEGPGVGSLSRLSSLLPELISIYIHSSQEPPDTGIPYHKQGAATGDRMLFAPDTTGGPARRKVSKQRNGERVRPLRLLQTLQSNDIEYIETDAFDGLISLRILDLGGNEISRIDSGAFYSLIRVDAIVLTEAELIELPVDIFEGLDGLRDLYVSDFRLCCRVTNLENCNDYAQTRFSTCTGGLLQYQVLSVFMWILGFSALLGNAFVLVMRLREKGGRSEKALIQAIMIMNLAAADFLTGVYMIFLASADAAYGSNYFVHAHIWRKGPLCKVVGVIAVLSSEASVLMITLISLDRLQGVVFPFSRFHLTKKSVKISAAVIWIVSVIMSLIPPIVTHVLSNGDSFYIYSDVCLGLPLIRSTEVEFTFQNFDSTANENNQPVVSSAAVGNYMYYSIIVFIGVNLLSFLIILFIYVTIFVYARRSARKAQRTPERDQELRLAARMALIIGTDFCCWMPIIIMGILAQSGTFVIPTELYAWCVVFILPINSAVNPHLYTLGDLYTRRREERESRKTSSSNSGVEYFPKEKKPPQASKESNF